MKYPIKSNWISYKKDYDMGMYIVRNHLGDEDDEYKMTKEEIMFLNLLNGKRNPIAYTCMMNNSERQAIKITTKR